MSGSNCEVRSVNIVKVETYGERALALVIGHEDINKKDHQYVEVICVNN